MNWQQKKLKGYFETAQKDNFSWRKWFAGNFAEKTSAYLNGQFGFRNLFVRLNNQIRFTLFRKSNVKDFVIGRKNYLYQQGYISEYNGESFWGEWAVNDSVAELRQLQDQFKSLGKDLLVVIAPSKARIYPEFIPSGLKKGPVKKCHYEAYKRALKEQGINHIDFNNWYLQKKDHSKYLLIPQLGVHWSRLEAIIAADTMIKYFARLSGKKLPQIKIKKLLEKDSLESPDDDALQSMNLLWQPHYKKMAYPEFEIIHKERAQTNLLVVSDSYWWDIYGRKIPEMVFKNNEFWYYNKQMYGSSYFGETDVKNFDIKRHLLQCDHILIVCAESNLGGFGFGFLKMALREMKKEITPTQEEINAYRKAIQDNQEWMKQIEEKAAQKKISVDEMLLEDIKWMFQQRGPLFKEPTVEDAIVRIKNDPVWLEQIKKGAREKGQNLDSAIKNNAIFVLEERKINKNK